MKKISNPLGIKTNTEKIIEACELDGSSLASVYVIEALRAGLQCYIDPKLISDEEIAKAWGPFDSPAGVRAKMKRILETIQQ